ncbi:MULTISPECIES: integrase [unclassified Pannonibacter]|uniref:integrase n=1 Tax=unclassified Pannonibacter TaxID=2627228 RepID=UPI001648384D|nr:MULTISPECIES: integrase [unclassified Pannonibacter]
MKISDTVKLSLDTADAATAKARFGEAYAVLQSVLQALSSPPVVLSHKQLLALAGEVRSAFVEAFDDEPGNASTWAAVIEWNTKARAGRVHPLKIASDETKLADMENRFGQFADVKLAQRGLSVSPQQRWKLIELAAAALDEAAGVNLRKALGDYSDTGETNRYPEFVPPAAVAASTPKQSETGNALTLEAVISEEVRRRSAGRDAVALRGATVKKFQIAAAGFCEFRGSPDAANITAREADAWKRDMLEKGELSNNTIKQRLQNLRTVVEWARQHSLGELYPSGNPLAIVKAPAFQTVASDARTFTMEEAARVLTAARLESSPDLRWLPWMTAYSGARINELAQLTPGDFFHVGQDFFYRLTTAGGKTLKTRASERVVPVHPEVIREGLVDFIASLSGRPALRIFPTRAQANIAEWVRDKLRIVRAELAPNHGWRHLFEDQCMNGGVTDAARMYITGRASGKSSEGYGKSQAMLPGLAREIRKVPAIPLMIKESA